MYAVFEAAMSIYDAVDLGYVAYKYKKGRSSESELAVTTAGVGLGLVGVGGGYGLLARKLLNSLGALSESAKLPSGIADYTRAGHSLTKHAHGQRPGSSVLPQLSGSPAAINAAAQTLVDDILTHPDRMQMVTMSKSAGVVMDFFIPSGQGVRYDIRGNFVGFIELGKVR